MSIQALKKFRNEVQSIFWNDIILQQVQEMSVVTLMANKKTIAKALNKIVEDENKKISVSKTGLFAGTGGAAGRQAPGDAKMEEIVSKRWSRLFKKAQKIFGKENVFGTSAAIYIALWDPGRGSYKGKIGRKNVTYTTELQAEIDGVRAWKDEFAEILKLKGAGDVDMSKLTAGGGGIRGKNAFARKFTFSHIQASKSEQALRSTKEHLSGSRAQAGVGTKGEMPWTDQEARSMAKGAAGFFDMTEVRIDQLLENAFGVTIGTKAANLNIGTGSTYQIKVSTGLDIIAEFDEIKTQALRDVRVNRAAISKIIKSILRNLENDFKKEQADMPPWEQRWWELEGSPSNKRIYGNAFENILIDSIVKGGKQGGVKSKVKGRPRNLKAKTQKTPPSKTSRKTRSRKIRTASPNKSKSGKIGGRNKQRATPWRNRGGMNPIGLKQLIMKSLPDHIAKKMTGLPTLQYQSGRFARSAEITDIAPMPNSVEIRYDYMQDPYRVFEPGSGSPLATRGRDPRALIGSSIREIAQLIMGNRFGLVRTKRI